MVFVEKSAKSELLEYYKHVIRLREKVPALYTENIEFIHENAEAKVLAYSRWSDEGRRAVVVAKFSDTYLSGNSIPKFPAAETWHEWMYNKIVEVGEEGFKFDLPEWSAQVFVLERENYVSRQMNGTVVQQ
jgi:1,4-alpha-glucan branching enzyme